MKIKKQVTRRRGALRWLAFLTLMTVWVVIFGHFRFLPIQAIREAERIGNIGTTTAVMELSGVEGRSLRGNENGIMVITLSFSLDVGWYARDRTYLDCSKPAPFYAGVDTYGFWKDGDIVGMADWFGRIDDPSAAAIRLEVYENDTLWDTFTVEEEDWIRKDGFTYFVLEFEKLGWSQYVRFQSALLDERGDVLDSREIEWDLASLRSHYETIHQ